MKLKKLWVEFGRSANFRIIPIHDLAEALGLEKSRVLLYFHAFTGCDTVSSFRWRGKKSAWSAWIAYPAVTNVFISLLSQPAEITPEILQEIERFVIIMYSKTCTQTKVNDARKELFAQHGRTIDSIPPTHAALLQHLKRAVFTSSFVWAQALESCPTLPDPANWGWHSASSGWIPN